MKIIVFTNLIHSTLRFPDHPENSFVFSLSQLLGEPLTQPLPRKSIKSPLQKQCLEQSLEISLEVPFEEALRIPLENHQAVPGSLGNHLEDPLKAFENASGVPPSKRTL